MTNHYGDPLLGRLGGVGSVYQDTRLSGEEEEDVGHRSRMSDTGAG